MGRPASWNRLPAMFDRVLHGPGAGAGDRGGRSRRLRLECLEHREMLSIGLSLLTGLGGRASVVTRPKGAITPAASVGSDTYGNTFKSAYNLSLAGDGSGTLSGFVETAGRADVFSIVAPLSGKLTIRQSAPAGSSLDSVLSLYDSQTRLLAQNDDNDKTLNSRVTRDVTAGVKYFVKAAGYRSSTGAYTLQFSTDGIAGDDYNNTFDSATLVTLPSNGSATLTGRIDPSFDIDMFYFVARVTGTATVSQSASLGSALDSYLTVYDSRQTVLAANNDSQGLDSSVVFDVVAGSVYYIAAGGYSAATGAYTLQIKNQVADDCGNTFATASTIAVTPSEVAERSGNIEQGGDVDMFRFVAAATGQTELRQMAAAGYDLDPVLYLYDGTTGREITRNDDSNGSKDSLISIQLVAGQTYYLKAAAFNGTTGAYTVRISPPPADDFGNTFAGATPIPLQPDNTATQTGTIEYVGDVDMFSFTAPGNGQLTVRLVRDASVPDNNLDPMVYVYNSAGQLVMSNDDTGGTNDSRVDIFVSKDQVYYIKAAAYGQTLGQYRVLLSFVLDNSFSITLNVTGFTPAEMQTAYAAAARWEQVIIGDLPNENYNGIRVDDMYMDLSGIYIDGPYGILGWSNATAFRSGSFLPYAGFIQLDTADMAMMEADGSLYDVIVHEMGHVLGLGVIWEDLHLLDSRDLNNPLFLGRQAIAAYNSTFGTTATGVPVEGLIYGQLWPGTSLAHWDEDIFDNELMTGFINAGSNPLSIITVASMADLGYTVDFNSADPYAPPSGIRSGSLAAGRTASGRTWMPDSFGRSTPISTAVQQVSLAQNTLFARKRTASVALLSDLVMRPSVNWLPSS